MGGGNTQGKQYLPLGVGGSAETAQVPQFETRNQFNAALDRLMERADVVKRPFAYTTLDKPIEEDIDQKMWIRIMNDLLKGTIDPKKLNLNRYDSGGSAPSEQWFNPVV
jgi:hypothetical protein